MEDFTQINLEQEYPQPSAIKQYLGDSARYEIWTLHADLRLLEDLQANIEARIDRYYKRAELVDPKGSVFIIDESVVGRWVKYPIYP